MEYNDELMHYGVLGMKWGQRRVRVNQAKAAKARKAGNTAAANKYSNKASRIERKHVRRAGGRRAYDYTKNQSTGKALAKSMLMGTYGTIKYNKARSEGKGRVGSAVRGIGAEAASRMTGGALEIMEPRTTARAGGRTIADTFGTGARAIKNSVKKSVGSNKPKTAEPAKSSEQKRQDRQDLLMYGVAGRAIKRRKKN